MNITMPAPAPSAPPATAPNDRVVGREKTSTSTTNSTERQTDDERTFEEQLDDVAVALARTTQPAPTEAPTKQPANPDPTTTATAAADGSTAAGAAFGPPTTAVVAVPAPTPIPSTPTDAALTTPSVAMTPVITEIQGPPTSVPSGSALETAEQVPSGDAPASASETQTLPTPGPAPTVDIPVGTDTPVAAPAADAVTPPAPFAALAASVHAAANTDLDPVADVEPVADVDGAGPAVTDATAQPALAIHAPATRHDTAPTSVGGAAAVISESADDLAMPARIAPPRTIAVDLNDEGLGPLRVIATNEQRTVHLTVSASEAVVRDALVRQQADLRHDLADVGLQLGSFEVDSRATDRDHANQPTATGDRDRPSARSTGALAVTAPIPSIHDADGRLDLRL